MLKPTLPTQIQPINADNENVITFDIQSNKQIDGNELIIEDRLGNEIYKNKQDTFLLEHVIPKNTLLNGMEYKLKIRARNISDEWSAFSDYLLFSCLDSGSVTIVGIDYNNNNKVYQQNVQFYGQWQHPNDVYVVSYRYFLYDDNGVLIKQFPVRYGDTLTEMITDLTNRQKYQIKLSVRNNKGGIDESSLISFNVEYIQIDISSLVQPTPNTGRGSIEINTKLIRLIGYVIDIDGNKLSGEEIDYLDNTKIDLINTEYVYLVFDEVISFCDNDYVFRIWFDDIVESTPYGQPFFTMYSNIGNIKFYYYDNRIHAFKSIDGITQVSHYVSDVSESHFDCIVIYSNNGRLDIETAKRRVVNDI